MIATNAGRGRLAVRTNGAVLVRRCAVSRKSAIAPQGERGFRIAESATEALAPSATVGSANEARTGGRCTTVPVTVTRKDCDTGSMPSVTVTVTVVVPGGVPIGGARTMLAVLSP